MREGYHLRREERHRTENLVDGICSPAYNEETDSCTREM